MNIKRKLKEVVMLHSLKKNIKQNPFNVNEIENYSLPENATASDTNSYYFSAHDTENKSILLRYAKRGDKSAEVWVVLKYDNELYINKKQIFNENDSPVKVYCQIPGKTWKITFQGEIYLTDLDNDMIARPIGKSKKLDMTMEFKATKDIFDFTYHINPRILAKALAKEKWNKAFIKNMRENQQRHYEQQGNVHVEFKLDDVSRTFNMRAMRDHSFGRRDWNYMDRHIWLMSLIGENESLNVNMVSYPHMKDLRTGYFENENNTFTVAMAPALRSFEANGRVPEQITYDVILDNGKALHVTANREAVINFKFAEGAYTICEGIGSFEVNGIKGRGIIEFGYNKEKNRWI